MKSPETTARAAEPLPRPALASANPGLALRSAKIQASHLERLAIVYIRQSSMHQVFNHVESRARQYELAELARALGWPAARVLVIDDDQGQSGRSSVNRDGFQRVLAEVSMHHVGIVLGLEMSRLARSCLDCQHLLEACALCGTLLGDQEGIYDPRDANDRLLLGLKGTLSEFELVTMRNRLELGKLHKAQRAALFHGAPVGYLKTAAGQLEMDPDEQVQAVVRLIFAQFEALGTQGRLLRYLWQHDICLGIRVAHGARRGQLEWRRAHPSTLRQILHRPVYAGGYAYGRTGNAGVVGTRKRRELPVQEWKVLQRDRVPAYISWEQYERNLERLRQNRPAATTAGVARSGTALLAGLLVCGHCGHHLQVQYPQRGRPCYRCLWARKLGRGPGCGSLRAASLDALVEEQVLAALQPAALELHLHAFEALEQERQRLQEHWQKRLEAMRYEVERIERQYQAVEPENRLVSRTLERRWEEALEQERQLQEDYERFCRSQASRLTSAERTRIEALAGDVPALWHAPATSNADRKEIVRCLLEQVTVRMQREGAAVQVTIHWQGGMSTAHELIRPVRRLEQSADAERLLARVRELRGQQLPAREIAARLNAEGFAPPQRRGPFTYDGVRQLLVRLGLAHGRKNKHLLARHEWWLKDLARELGVAERTLTRWIQRGWLHARQTPVQHFWVAWADRSELSRLRKLKACRREGNQELPQELTTPKIRK